MATHSEIQHTRLKGEKVFQSFCLKLIRRQWNDPYAVEHGRRGQGQQGTDITGTDKRGGFQTAGVQCKGSETHEPRELTETEIEEEVEKAKKFVPKLDLLIIAYNGERDAKLQKKARELDNANHKAGLFKVVLWSWDDIVENAMNFSDVMEELLVQNNVPRSDLDPKRPRVDRKATLDSLAGSLTTTLSAVQAALVTDAPSDATGDPIAQAKIDVWRDQILRGDGSVTVAPLKAFIQSMDSETSPRVRFRAYANLGAAQTQCGDYEAAAISFDEAHEAEPESADGFAYAARAATLRHQDDKAFAAAEKALAIDPAHKLAAAIFIDAAPPTVSNSDLEARTGATLSEFDVGWALARRYSEAEDHEAALRVARAIEAKPENWARDMAIAEAILRRFEANRSLRIGAPAPPEDVDAIREAKSLLEKTWKTIQARTDKRNWAHVSANLGTAHRLLGDDASADAFAIEAFDLQPANRQLKERAALAYIHKQDFQTAFALAEELAIDGGGEDQLFAAHVCASAKKWAELEVYARRAFEKLSSDEDRARAAELIILAEQQTKDASSAMTTAKSLRSEFAPSVAFEARVAELARRLGDEGEIAATSAALDRFDPQSLNALERFELADAFADNGQWSRTADLLADLHVVDRASEILRRRLFALYRADRRSDARSLFESLTKDALKDKEVLRLGAAIYERSGMLREASAALKRAIDLAPSDLRSRLDWARLCIRNGDEAPLQKWLKKAPVDFVAPPEDVMELAQLLDRAGRRKDALKLGYEALRKHWGHSERLHMMFMSLFLLKGTKIEPWLKPKEVAGDVVVFLKDDRGAASHFRIETTPDAQPDVLAHDHPFAASMIGHKVGDTIASAEGIGQPTSFTITELKHKYVDLLHRAMESHNTLFPGSTALGSFHIEPNKENAFEPIFEQVRERARIAQDATQLYQNSPVPVDTVAKVLGIDPIDASLGIRFRSNTRFDSCIGSHDERVRAIAAFESAKSILVDPVTLAHWNEIGFLPDIEAMPDFKLEIVQGTLDVFTARADEAKRAITQGGGSLEAHGEKFAMVELTVAQKKEIAAKASDLLKWVRDHTTVVPTESIVSVTEDDASHILSSASIDTVATAAASKKIFTSDDRRLRALAQSLEAPIGGWTQPLLVALQKSGALSEARYVQLISQLHRENLGFVSVGPNDLLVALKADDQADFEALLEALTRATVDVRSLIQVLQDFFAALWLDPQFVAVRDRVTSEIFRRIMSARLADRFKILRITITEFNRTLNSLPFPMNYMSNAWERYAVGFIQGHFLTGVINE